MSEKKPKIMWKFNKYSVSIEPVVVIGETKHFYIFFGERKEKKDGLYPTHLFDTIESCIAHGIAVKDRHQKECEARLRDAASELESAKLLNAEGVLFACKGMNMSWKDPAYTAALKKLLEEYGNAQH